MVVRRSLIYCAIIAIATIRQKQMMKIDHRTAAADAA